MQKMFLVEYVSSTLESLSKDDLSRLDGWRGFLAFLVVIAHSNQIFIAPIIGTDNYFYWTIGVIAHFSVLGFFVISGIAIAMSLLLNIKRNNNEVNFREFILARVSRIYPPLFFSIFISVLFLIIMSNFNLLGIDKSYKLSSDLYIAREYFNFTVKDVYRTLIFDNLGLVKVNGPLWSLIYEWWLYFFGLLLVNIFFVKKNILKLMSLILLVVVYNKIKHAQGLVYIVIWMLGFVFYLFGRRRNKVNKIFVLVAIGCLFGCNYLYNFTQNKLDVSTLPAVQILFSILFLGLIFKFPKNSFFNAISKFSYSLYIIHFPVFLFLLSIFHRSTHDSLLLCLILCLFSISLVMFVSYKTYIYFENKKYFIVLIDSYLTRLSNLFSSLSKSIKSS